MMQRVVVFLALLAAVYAQTYTVNLNFTGGLPICTQCGPAGQYACSPSSNHPQIGDWNNGTLTFQDPLPAGLYASGITAVIYGSYGCNSQGDQAVIELTLNGEVIDIHQGTSPSICKCNTCGGPITFSSAYNPLSPSLPFYKSKGENTVQINVYTSSICVSTIEVTINATKDVSEVAMMEVPLDFSDEDCQQTCGPSDQCWCSRYIGDSLSSYFNDPLPNNAVLLSAAIAIYGYATGTNSYNISATLGGAVIGQTPVPWPITLSACAGRIYFYDTDIYQNGWPGYSYGSQNSIILNPGSNQRFCIGTFVLQLFYYVSGDALPF